MCDTLSLEREMEGETEVEKERERQGERWKVAIGTKSDCQLVLNSS